MSDAMRVHHHVDDAELEVRPAPYMAMGQADDDDGKPSLSLLLRGEHDTHWLFHEMDLPAAEQFAALVDKHLRELRERTR